MELRNLSGKPPPEHEAKHVLSWESIMATKDFTVSEDVWIGNVENKPVDPASAAAGAFRLKKGEKITNERAREIGLLSDSESEKAEDHAPEDKAVKKAAKK